MAPHSEIADEPVLDPELPIIDAHHHLWLLVGPALQAAQSWDNPFGSVMTNSARYLLDEYLSDVRSGHNVIASIYVDAHAMYKGSGPEAFRSVGEVEFAAGVAAMCESGVFGETRACAAIVGNANLRLGDDVEPVLEAHIEAAGGRYRGIRNSASFDADPAVLATAGTTPPHILADDKFRSGLRHLRKHNLSFDVWVLEPQLPELIDLARAFPDTQIILNHLATPLGRGRYAGTRAERFPIWRGNMKSLAQCANVAVKLGGLGLPFPGFAHYAAEPRANSEELARDWRPYIETCVEAFGAARCMFESNFPVDAGAGSYRALWNAFKRITEAASQDERRALFSGTAASVYRIDI